MKKQFFLLTLLVLTVTTFAQSGKIKFTEYDLDNGLHVILHQDKSTPIVAVTVSYHVGSKNEEVGKTGFAHFFEHLLFEGTKNVPKGKFDAYILEAGGTLNANTTQDRTFYYEILPSNELKLGLWLESERMLQAVIKQIGVDTQREVVKEERRMRYENQPYSTFTMETFERAYVNHPYHWTPIGSMEDLNSAKLDDFIAFYNKFYIPNNACLSIAGDIDIEQAKEWIELYFGDIPRGEEVVQPELPKPENRGEIRDVIYDNIQLPAVITAYRIPPQNSEDAYALDLVTYILSNGQSSRLKKKLVDEDQSAVYVGAFPYSLEQGGLFMTFSIANQGFSVDDLESVIDDEISKLQTELIGEKEYEKVMNQIENNFVSSNSSMNGIAESLSDYYMYYGNTNLINTEIKNYQNITREDIRNAAKKYLTKDNRVVLHYLPKTENQGN